MKCDCPTCCCEYAGTFPKFAFYYDDGKVYRGGGPEDTKQKVLSFPQSWFDMPMTGVLVGLSEDPRLGRRVHTGAEQYYAIPHQCLSGADVAPSGPETRLIPFVGHALGLVKLGQYTTIGKYQGAMEQAQADTHVLKKSAYAPHFTVSQEKD